MSIELTNLCSKGCPFCYNGSRPSGATEWLPDDVIAFAKDCAANGVAAVSFGGGEPLQYPGLLQILRELEGTMFRSVTTNGLLLDDHVDALVATRVDKVHVSLHFPEREGELARVIRQVQVLQDRGIRSGVNLLVRQSQLDAAAAATQCLRRAGIELERIMFLPMRGGDTPSPRQLGRVAAHPKFQSMTCLLGCAASPRFASISWDRQVGWCSYTHSRRRLLRADFASLIAALDGLELATTC